MPFPSLAPQLAADTLAVCDLSLCTVRLMNDARFPWLILVPMREGKSEIIDLLPGEQAQLLQEINLASRALQQLTKTDKLNIAALGNMVPQLHIHVIARHKNDTAWPKPVWGQGVAEPYKKADELIGKIKQLLSV